MMFVALTFDWFAIFYISCLAGPKDRDGPMRRGPISPKEKLVSPRVWKSIVVHASAQVLYLAGVLYSGTRILNRMYSDKSLHQVSLQKGFDTMDN
jgi:magnesium-transporting ATPase (P-type)